MWNKLEWARRIALTLKCLSYPHSCGLIYKEPEKETIFKEGPSVRPGNSGSVGNSWNVNISLDLKIPSVACGLQRHLYVCVWAAESLSLSLSLSLGISLSLSVSLSLSLSLSPVFAADELTISVSDTGPKLVTKMFVLISVTFSVERAQVGKFYGVENCH